MASSLDYVEYVCDQMSDAGHITYKKMFGEYAIYCNLKCFGLICENQVFINPTKAGQEILPNANMAIPYTGAKPRILLEELDDREFLSRFVIATCDELALPKPKKKKATIKE
ncbi:MAG: TfoX/Sxy family protein [Oscillospiraceae bacterium]